MIINETDSGILLCEGLNNSDSKIMNDTFDTMALISEADKLLEDINKLDSAKRSRIISLCYKLNIGSDSNEEERYKLRLIRSKM